MVSPKIKLSWDTTYFNGEISDSKNSVCVYGYNDGVQKKPEFYKEIKSSL